MRVREHLVAFNSLCGTQMRVREHLLAFDSLCGAGMGDRERVLAFNSLWTGLVIVTSNVNNSTNCLNIPPTHPPFREKSLISVFHTFEAHSSFWQF